MYLAIIPAFNEEKSIGNILREIGKYVDHIVVIDDCSTDRTAELAKDLGATVLHHYSNQGVGAAMITGVKYAKKIQPKIVLTIDADGQHRLEDIPRLMKPIVTGKAEWVLGSRFLRKRPVDMPLIKKLGNRFLTLVTSFLAGVRLTDTQTGFRAFNQSALLALDLVSKFTYTQEMIMVLCHKGYRGVEVPISTSPRKHGNSKVTSNIARYAIKSLLIVTLTYLRLRLKSRLKNGSP